jgi:membrane protein YqaA with SNARE-associated domain
MKSLLDRSYIWAERWTGTRYSILALCILVFLDSCLFPFPTTIIFITVSLFHPLRSNFNAVIATTAMGIGGIAGYCIGYYMWLTPGGDFTPMARFFFEHVPGFDVNLYQYISDLYNQWSYGIFFSAIFLPIPFQIYSISAGAFDVNLIIFVITTFLFQGIRFFALAFLVIKFGEGVKLILQKHLKLIAVTVLGILLIYIAGVLVLQK